jgi:nitrite reductase/ring-hydroxylating ferredoxin subunit
MACREEDLPEVGDHVVYEIGPTSLIVVRSEEDTIRAFYNSCLHRGTLLRQHSGNVSQFRCPFHSFTWDLHGEINRIPCEWDFQGMRERVAKLPEARLGTWGGFVFVNLDEDAESLESYLESVPQDFERWPLERRFTAAHVAKELDCNWKVAQEAFIEVFHAIGIHPQSLPMFGDANAQYDVWPGRRHTSRMINLSAVASPHLNGYSEQRILDTAAEFGLCEKGSTVPEGKRARDVVVGLMRERFGRDLGVDTTELSDTEVMDVIQYNIFPNLMVFGGLGSPLVYRVRPLGDDPGRCLFEVWLLLPFSDDSPRPPASPLRVLSADERWSSVDELGYFGPILDQDFDMMPQVQQGLRASKTRQVVLSAYQESRIRHMRQTLDEYVGR